MSINKESRICRLWAGSGKAARTAVLCTAALLAVFILFTAANLSVSFFSRKAGCSKVPDIVGCTLEEAQEMLEKRDFRLLITGRTTSDDVPCGIISAQHMASGSYCAENTVITADINIGALIYAEDSGVPQLLYLNVDEAAEDIETYSVAVIKEPCSWAADGLIIAQRSSEGRTMVTVSENPAADRIDYTGLQIDDVLDDAAETPTACEVGYVLSDEAEAGSVLSCESDGCSPVRLTVSGKKSFGTVGLWLSKRSVSLDTGECMRLIAKEISLFAALRNTQIIWQSSDPSVASVDCFGNVTAHSEGTAFITASTANGKFKAVCEVTAAHRLTGIQLFVPQSRINAIVGSEYDCDGVTVQAVYSDGTCIDVTNECKFSVIDTSAVCTALVRAVYTEDDAEYTATYKVNIAEEHTSLSSDYIEVGVKCRKQLTVETNIYGEISFASSDESICTVDSNGVLTGVSPGSCKISVSCGGEVAAVCDVAVKKAMLLTFDDGPNSYTETILKILDEQEVKATFFVIGQPEFRHLYSEIIDRGHVLGLHTYSHDFTVCYKSADDFFDELYRLNDLLEENSVEPVRLFRFPGGSNNNMCYNILKDELIARAAQEGFIYCDWNAQDCEIVAGDYIVMLMHEVVSDVRNLREMIIHYKSKGYIFETVSENVELIHLYIPTAERK